MIIVSSIWLRTFWFPTKPWRSLRWSRSPIGLLSRRLLSIFVSNIPLRAFWPPTRSWHINRWSLSQIRLVSRRLMWIVTSNNRWRAFWTLTRPWHRSRESQRLFWIVRMITVIIWSRLLQTIFVSSICLWAFWYPTKTWCCIRWSRSQIGLLSRRLL